MLSINYGLPTLGTNMSINMNDHFVQTYLQNITRNIPNVI